MRKYRFLFLIFNFIMIFTTFALSASAQDTSPWELPSDAIARFGKGGATEMSYSPDGTYFAVGTRTGTVWLYETENYQPVRILEYEGYISGVSFSPDSKLLLTDPGGEGVLIHDVETGILLNTFCSTGSYGIISVAVFSDDGKYVNVWGHGGWDAPIDVWDVETGAHVESIPAEAEGRPSFEPFEFPNKEFGYSVHITKYPYTWTWSKNPDDRLIATWRPNGATIEIWDFNTGELLHSFLGALKGISYWGDQKVHSASYIHRAQFSPDGQFLAVLGEQSEFIPIFDTNSGEQVHIIDGHKYDISSVAFSPDGQTLGIDDGTTELWDINANALLQKLISFPTPPGRTASKGSFVLTADVVFSPDGQLVVHGGKRDTIFFVDVNTGEPRHTIYLPLSYIFSDIAFSRDMKICATADRDSNIHLWDVETDTHLRTLVGHDPIKNGNATIGDIDFSFDGKILASAGHDDTARLWDVETGNLLHTLKDGEQVYTVAFSPDDKLLLTGGQSDIIRLWDVATGKLIYAIGSKFGHNKGFLLNNTFDPNKRLVSDTPLARIESLIFSPDGHVIVSGDWNGSVDFWDVESGSHLHRIDAHNRQVEDLDFSSNGRLLASCGDGVATVWNYEEITSKFPDVMSLPNVFNPEDVVFGPEDVNFDRTIDILDLVLVAKKLGDVCDARREDVNNDGIVDILDLVLVANALSGSGK